MDSRFLAFLAIAFSGTHIELNDIDSQFEALRCEQFNNSCADKELQEIFQNPPRPVKCFPYEKWEHLHDLVNPFLDTNEFLNFRASSPHYLNYESHTVDKLLETRNAIFELHEAIKFVFPAMLINESEFYFPTNILLPFTHFEYFPYSFELSFDAHVTVHIVGYHGNTVRRYMVTSDDRVLIRNPESWYAKQMNVRFDIENKMIVFDADREVQTDRLEAFQIELKTQDGAFAAKGTCKM